MNILGNETFSKMSDNEVFCKKMPCNETFDNEISDNEVICDKILCNKFVNVIDLTEQDLNLLFNKICIPANIKQMKLKSNNLLAVTMQINIEQLNQWLYSHNYQINSSQELRKIWYNFCDYVKDIIEYGYHFNNVKNINKFFQYTIYNISPIDDFLNKTVTDKYDLCSAAEVAKFNLSEDKNNLEFNIFVEVCLKNNDPDYNVNTQKLPLNDEQQLNHFLKSIQNISEKNDKYDNEENEDNEDNENNEENEDNDNSNDEDVRDNINEKKNKKKEELDELMDEYYRTGIKHGRIAAEILKREEQNASEIEFIRMLGLQPKVVSHILNDDIISLKLIITKRIFSRLYLLYRSNAKKDIDVIWQKFKEDIAINTTNYTSFDWSNINTYLLNNHFIFKSIKCNIRDVDLQKDTAIYFWTDIIINKEDKEMK